MKILLFTYLFPNSKLPNRGIFNLSRAKALIKAGCEVIAVAPVSVNPSISSLLSPSKIKEQFSFLKILKSIPSVEHYEGIKAYHPKWITAPRKIFWKHILNILHFFIGRKLDEIISEFQPDLIISTWLNPFSAYSKYFKKYSGVKHFAIAEGSDLLVQPLNYNGWDKIENSINENSNLVIAVSEKMKNRMEQTTKLQRIKFIQNGYDESIFYLDEKAEKTHDKYFRIITVANFNYAKGHDILLEALQYIKIPFKLTLIGEGPLLNKCNKFIEEHGLQNVVNNIGPIPHNNIPGLLLNHDLFCLPSRSEGFPAAPLEAMACGLPVVAANVGGMNEIIIEGFNGFLCKPESPEDIAEKINVASGIQWEKEKISEWASNNFSWNSWAAKIIDSYNNLN